MKTQTSEDYELFTQTLQQKIISEQGYQDIQVLHNVTLIGKSGAKHQIDVCWKIEIGGIQQLFCVECKQWKSKVKKDHIASFITKLDDIGNARGLFATTNGYQIGAQRLAKHNGIVLINATYEVYEHKTLIEITKPRFDNVRIAFAEVDDDIKNEIIKMSCNPNTSGEIDTVNSLGLPTGCLSDLLDYITHEADGHYATTLDDTYIQALDHLVQAKEVEYDYTRNIMPELTLTGSYELAKASIRYIFDDKEISKVLSSHRNPKYDE